MKLTLIITMLISTFLITAYADEKLTDAEITRVITETNEGEIEIARFARKKASNEEVKNYAELMISEHGSNHKTSKQLLRKLNLKAITTEKSKEVKQESEKVLSKLKETDEKIFDKSFIDAQINIHQNVLSTLEESLIPAARNPELKAHLEKTRSSVSEHLEHAKKIQSVLQ